MLEACRSLVEDSDINEKKLSEKSSVNWGWRVFTSQQHITSWYCTPRAMRPPRLPVPVSLLLTKVNRTHRLSVVLLHTKVTHWQTRETIQHRLKLLQVSPVTSPQHLSADGYKKERKKQLPSVISGMSTEIPASGKFQPTLAECLPRIAFFFFFFYFPDTCMFTGLL